MKIRPVEPRDAAELSSLMGQLGYEASPELIARKITLFSAGGDDHALVAEIDGEVAGVIALHVFEVFHVARRVGKITALVVDGTRRKAGVGRALVAEVERFCVASGCARIEVTSANHRADAHAFYESLGYAGTGRRFSKYF